MHRRADGAPGDRRSIGDEVERGGLKGLKTEADHERAGDCDGSAESGGAFDESAEAEGHEQKLQTAIGRDRGDGLLHDFELAGFDGNVVEKNGGDDDPDDFEEAKSRAVEKATNSEARGHSENDDCANDGGCGAGDGAKMRPHSKSRQQAQQDDDWQRRDESGKPPMSQRIVNLSPSHSRTSSTLAIAKFRHAQFPWPLAKKNSAWLSWCSRSGNLAFRSLRYFLTAFLSSDNCFLSPPKLRANG